MTEQPATASVTGDVIYEAEFDPKIASHGRALISLIMFVTIVGIPFIPFMLLFTMWYYPEYMRRISARVTTQAVEIKKGVFFRKEATIPLNRITDVRLHDGPLMRYYGLRGVAIETAGQSGTSASSEGNLIGVVDSVKFRDVVLTQRQKVLGTAAAEDGAAPQAASVGSDQILTEIRDILVRIEEQGRPQN